MGIREVIELVLLALVVVNLGALSFGILAVLKTVSRSLDQLQGSIAGIQSEVVPALRGAKAALEHVERLAESTDSLVHAELTPTLQVTRATLGNVEKTTRVVSQTVEGVGRVAAVVNAVTEPASLGTTVGRALQSSTGRIGLVAYGVRAGLRALLSNGAKRAEITAPVTGRNSNGPAGQ